MFKRLFGENHDKKLLIGLLNAILHADIIDVCILEEKLSSQKIDEKQGFLDIKAQCHNGDKINIEVQLRDQKNMIPRTLLYWSRLYAENFFKNAQYADLRKTIMINILGFMQLKPHAYHSRYRLCEVDTKHELTDLAEIHFLEYPKFKKMNQDLHNSLHRWLLFLQQDASKQQLEEVIRMDPLIKHADEKLWFLSADEEVRRIAELREKGIADQISREQLAEERGRLEGEQKGKLEEKMETAKRLLEIGLSMEQISNVTNLSAGELTFLQQ